MAGGWTREDPIADATYKYASTHLGVPPGSSGRLEDATYGTRRPAGRDEPSSGSAVSERGLDAELSRTRRDGSQPALTSSRN